MFALRHMEIYELRMCKEFLRCRHTGSRLLPCWLGGCDQFIQAPASCEKTHSVLIHSCEQDRARVGRLQIWGWEAVRVVVRVTGLVFVLKGN